MKKNKITLIIIALLVIGFVAFKLAGNKNILNEKAEKAIQDQRFDVIPVIVANVKQIDISNALSESGTFKAIQELRLTAQSQGQITKLHATKSQFVKKGTLLAVIDNSSLKSQIETARASLDKAMEDAKRFSAALKAGGVSKLQEEEARLRVQSAESQLATLTQQSQNYQITAPMDGIVNDIFVEAGSTVSPGSPLLVIVDITKVNLTVRIDQKNLPDLKMGQKVNVSSDVYPNHIFEGKVSTVNVKTDLSQKIEVGVTVENREKTPLLEGMYGHAEFINDKNKSKVFSLMIPRDAITGSIQDPKVYVVNGDSTVTLRNIVAGRIINSNVEVVSGLKENDMVVTAGQINLENGTKVNVKN